MSNDKAREGVKMERYDSISTRIVDAEGRVVAIIEQLSNGRWIVTDNGKKLTERMFGTPRIAFLWFSNQ